MQRWRLFDYRTLPYLSGAPLSVCVFGDVIVAATQKGTGKGYIGFLLLFSFARKSEGSAAFNKRNTLSRAMFRGGYSIFTIAGSEGGCRLNGRKKIHYDGDARRNHFLKVAAGYRYTAPGSPMLFTHEMEPDLQRCLPGVPGPGRWAASCPRRIHNTFPCGRLGGAERLQYRFGQAAEKEEP